MIARYAALVCETAVITTRTSLAAYLCGITDIDPLEPHYRCPKCRHSEFAADVRSGYDLPAKKCPDCGTEMTRSREISPPLCGKENARKIL